MRKPDRWKIIAEYQDLAELIRRITDDLQLVNMTPKVETSVQASRIEALAERLLGEVVDLEEYNAVEENKWNEDDDAHP